MRDVAALNRRIPSPPFGPRLARFLPSTTAAAKAHHGMQELSDHEANDGTTNALPEIGNPSRC